MSKTFWLMAAASVLAASSAHAEVFRFDFTGTVLAETRPNLTVTPQAITGTLQYTAPAGGDITTQTGNATLTASLYGNFIFSTYTATLSDTLFTFSAQDGSQSFSLRASSLPGGGFGFVGSPDGFALTGTPVNASGRLGGTFANAAAVPEPASWLMMIGGMGLVGAALRKRRLVRSSFGKWAM